MNIRSTLVLAPSLAALLSCVACGGTTLDLGGTDGGTNGLIEGVDDSGTPSSPPVQSSASLTDIATSESTPPYGIWAMAINYGPVGQAVDPTPALQVELRPDGTAYRWLCAGDPDDGSVTTACAVEARAECLGQATISWTGTRWNIAFDSDYTGILNQGDITPDGKGNILIDYIDPTYSGGLFRKVSDVPAGDPGCTP